VDVEIPVIAARKDPPVNVKLEEPANVETTVNAALAKLEAYANVETNANVLSLEVSLLPEEELAARQEKLVTAEQDASVLELLDLLVNAKLEEVASVETIVNAALVKLEVYANAETNANVLNLEQLPKDADVEMGANVQQLLVAKAEVRVNVGQAASVLDHLENVNARLEETANVEIIASAVTVNPEEFAHVETTVSVRNLEVFPLELDRVVSPHLDVVSRLSLNQ